MTVHVIFYYQYGEWRCTVPFTSLRAAEKHARLYLNPAEKTYISRITYREVELPE